MNCVRRRVTLFIFILLSTHALAGTVLESQTFKSDALGEMTYSVFLPNGYKSDSRAYPVVYLLHGYSGSDTDWIRFGDVAFTAERLIAENQIPPMIIIMPGGNDSWYVPSKKFGNVERAFTKDLVAHVDATYRTIPERTSRAIGGLSMGGYGAAYLAFNHPDVYAAVGVMSGALFRGVPPLDNAGIDRETLFAGAFGEPFNPTLWRERNPFTAITKLAKAEENLAVYITVGDDDVFTFYRSSTAFYTALQNANVSSQLRITEGGHSWAVWSDALPEVLIFFADSFEQYYQGPDPKPLVAYRVRPDYATPFILSRFEDNDLAVLETEAGTTIVVPRVQLPPETKEGDVLLEPTDSECCGDVKYAVDFEATEQRRRGVADLLRNCHPDNVPDLPD